jgi:phage-related protein
MIKPVKFRGDALESLRRFPESARQDAVFNLTRFSVAVTRTIGSLLRSIGPGVKEIRIRDVTGAFRVIYLATLADAVYVQKSEQTSNKDIQLARKRYKDLMGEQM